MSPSDQPSSSLMSQTAEVQRLSSLAAPRTSAIQSAEPTVPGDASRTQPVLS